MARRPEDATIWIGYADFLSTLAILFFILVVALAAKIKSPPQRTITGKVLGADGSVPLVGCVVTLGKADTTNAEGGFRLSLDSLGRQSHASIDARCARYEPSQSIVALVGDSTSRLELRLRQSEGIVEKSLPGDALFEPNQFELKPEAARLIDSLGKEFQKELGTGDVVAVQGHTDDLEFAAGAGKDNLMLSSQRAWSAARVLYTQVGISRCQVVTMGFGSSRPVAPIRAGQPRDSIAARRARNRRIEFRLLKGSSLVGETCAS